MIRSSLTLILLSVLVLPLQAEPQDDPPKPEPNKVKTFMRAKLKHAQSALEGLTLEDYDQIAREAQEMSLLSLASNWQVLQTPKYLELSGDFRRTVNRMRDEAKEKNLDAATIAYVEMTLKCVNCHQYVRKVRMANNDQPLPADLVGALRRTAE